MNQNEQQANYSETISRSLKSNPHRDNLDYLDRLYEHYLPYFPEDKNAKILDMGCGGGLFLKFCLLHGYQNISGLDSDPSLVADITEWIDVDVITQDFHEHLGEVENTYDAIFMNNVIEHIKKDDLVLLLGEIKRALKPGGVFMATTGNIENPMNLGLFLRDFTHEIGFTLNSLRQACMFGGFEGDKVQALEKDLRFGNKLTHTKYLVESARAEKRLRRIIRAMKMRIDSLAKFIFCVCHK
ncbi:MAG: methyltransferase domain-containing protein [Gammaproteobacteria bacterium]|nr:methyltransferase domain-containing protein [Gammaproteobacteria bacterium]